MISDITGMDYGLLEDNIILETNELPINRKNEKAKRCDFILKIDNDNIINLELNRQCYDGLMVKNLSYLCQLFSSSSKRGEEYNDNLVVMQINLNCFKDNDYENMEPLSKYHLREDTSNKLYVKNISIYELNVVKCHELYYNVNRCKIPNYVRWGALLYCNDIKDIPEIVKGIMTNEERDLIMGSLDKLTREDLFYTEEEALEWAEWERRSIETEIRKKATEEGLAEGLAQGLAQGIEQGIEQGVKLTIKNMLKKNISIENISSITGKSIEEINRIKEEQ